GTPFAGMEGAIQGLLLPEECEAAGDGSRKLVARALPFALAAQSLYRYPRREDVPSVLPGEFLPPVAADFEARLAAFVDFSPEVLADRLRHRVQVKRDEADLFS